MAALLCRRRSGKRPVIAIVADCADELFLGHDFEHTGEVADKPVLTGNGTGIARHLVLVVIHQDNAVGVGGNLLQVGVRRGDCGVDPQSEVVCMQIYNELMDEAEVGGIGIVRKAFKIQRKTAIDRIRGEEPENLCAQQSAV